MRLTTRLQLHTSAHAKLSGGVWTCGFRPHEGSLGVDHHAQARKPCTMLMLPQTIGQICHPVLWAYGLGLGAPPHADQDHVAQEVGASLGKTRLLMLALLEAPSDRYALFGRQVQAKWLQSSLEANSLCAAGDWSPKLINVKHHATREAFQELWMHRDHTS